MDLVDGPDDPVAEQPADRQPYAEQAEPRPGEHVPDPRPTLVEPVVVLGPVEMQGRHPVAVVPEPAH